jgi:hypothetical protein
MSYGLADFCHRTPPRDCNYSPAEKTKRHGFLGAAGGHNQWEIIDSASAGRAEPSSISYQQSAFGKNRQHPFYFFNSL